MQGIDSPGLGEHLDDAGTERRAAQRDIIGFIIAGMNPGPEAPNPLIPTES